MPRPIAWLAAILISLSTSGIGRARFVTYAHVQDILTALTQILPPALKNSGTPFAETWASWIADHDREIRARLERGDDDTIVYWLLFGTSFTTRPRAFMDQPSAPAEGDASDQRPLAQLIADRTTDFVQALTAPGVDERRLFARRLFERKGFGFGRAEDRTRLEAYLLSEVARVTRERSQYVREIEELRKLPDVSEQFALRSRLFRDRGLSLDTSLLPGFALDQTLQRMRAGSFVSPASIRRVGIIGPGLDFADKSTGYDFYPQQTLQPYALLETLVRLGLSDPATVQITAFDISPRVNNHLTRARARARNGSPYVVRLPLDLGIPWKPAVVEYWRTLGNRIGAETPQARQTTVRGAPSIRTVRIRPQFAARVAPEDLNIVAQRSDGAPFDLIVATNILVYYDTLDQSLALANVEAMLRPGGFLLSNNALLELPISKMRSVGYLTIEYSARPDDGDHMVWYQRSSGR